MLYVATVHFRDPRWIEIQTDHLRRHVTVPYEVWTSLEGIEASHGERFDRVLDSWGTHAAKLNHLALEICHVAEPDDVLVFLDGDAFPIADPLPLIESALAESELVAVRRAENLDEPQPHPCFCASTVGAWKGLAADWTAGYSWRPGISDVGGNLLRRLELSGAAWTEVLRSNGDRLDPLNFGIYGGVIYHHGEGFRGGGLSPIHRAAAPRGETGPLGRLRWARWERREKRRIAHASREVYEAIRAEDGWQRLVA